MEYTIINILALILLVAAAIKILVILISPKSWVKVTKKVWKYPLNVMVASLVLAALVLYLLISSGITIIQIFAVMLFVGLLAAAGVAMYSKVIVNAAARLLRDREIIKKSWIYILVWVILILWGLKELFM